MGVTTFTLHGIYELLTCNHEGCGMQFAVPEHVVDGWRESHKTWYCPNGHARHFPSLSDKERLAREAAQKQAEIDRLQTDLRIARERRDMWERSANARKGQVTKIKNRIASGVCPCCQRTFSNLAAHMKGQHPDYAKESV